MKGVAGMHEDMGGADGSGGVGVVADGWCNGPAPSDGNRGNGWLLRWQPTTNRGARYCW